MAEMRRGSGKSYCTHSRVPRWSHHAAARRRQAEYPKEILANTFRGVRARQPECLAFQFLVKNAEDRCAVDLRNRQVAEDWIDVVAHRGRKALVRFRVLPLDRVDIQVHLRNLAESLRALRFFDSLTAVGAPYLYWVFAVCQQLPRLAGTFARFLEREDVERAQSVEPLAPVELVAAVPRAFRGLGSRSCS